ncbi:MAG: aminopeptidase, partial [Sphaerochaeta sp.]
MQEILRRYARLIIEIQLKLQGGDALSINTESSTMAFARMLATMACESTHQTVTIVETNHGKIAQTLEFDPVEHRIKRPEITGYVMCHLVDLDNAPYVTDENVFSAAEEVTKLATYGLLSDPVFLDRRIAVPWANIPLPGPLWAMQLLGKAASEEEMWTLFSKLYRLEDDHGLKFWNDQS